MARMLLSLLATLFVAAHSHPAGLECGTDATTRLQDGKTIMNSVVAKAPADAPIKVEVHGSRVTITSKAGTFFAAKAFGDRAKVVIHGDTSLNMTKNCSNQVFVDVGMENSTTYTFHQFGATSIVVGYASAPGVVSLVTAEVPKLAVAASSPPTVEIAPGVHMPLVNDGGGGKKFLPSNYSLWLELGGRGLDTALTYGDDTQRDVGAAIRASGIPRDQIFVTTKVPCPGQTSGDVEHDLEMLGLDYVDLMLLHWPCRNSMTQTISVYKGLEAHVKSKKARAIGISNFNAREISQLMEGISLKPAVNQNQFSVGYHDLETLKKCQDLNITYSAYSPLGGLSHVDVLHDPTVTAIAKAHNKSTAQVALRWVVQQGVVAVTASTKRAHLQSDMEIFDFELTQDEVSSLTKVGAELQAIHV